MKKILITLVAFLIIVSMTGCDLPGKLPSGTQSSSETTDPGTSGTPSGTDDKKIENKVDLSLDKSKYEKEERIEVTLDFGKLNQESAVIVVVKSDTEHGKETAVHEDYQYESYRWLADFTELPFYLWTPNKDGLFDVRVYANSNGGDELASVTVAVGNATLPGGTGGNSGTCETTGSGENPGGEKPGAYTKKDLESLIIKYLSPVSSLSSITLCEGSKYEVEEADGMFMLVDVLLIYDAKMDYNELAKSLNTQMTAAGFTHYDMAMTIGGHEWYVTVGDKKMYLQLRPFYEGDEYYMLYCTPTPIVN